MSSTRSDAELFARVDQALKQWDKVAIEVHRNVWTADKPRAPWQLCFSVEAEGEKGVTLMSGARDIRELFEAVCKYLDKRAVKRVTERLE